MKRFRLRYFAWISLTALLLSCAAPRISLSDVRQEPGSGSDEMISCRAIVQYQDQDITGRVLIKKYGAEEYRIAFYNEMGMTYLEGTLKGHKLELQNIMPVLDNRVFLRKFEKAIQKNLNNLTTI